MYGSTHVEARQMSKGNSTSTRARRALRVEPNFSLPAFTAFTVSRLGFTLTPNKSWGSRNSFLFFSCLSDVGKQKKTLYMRVPLDNVISSFKTSMTAEAHKFFQDGISPRVRMVRFSAVSKFKQRCGRHRQLDTHASLI